MSIIIRKISLPAFMTNFSGKVSKQHCYEGKLSNALSSFGARILPLKYLINKCKRLTVRSLLTSLNITQL